MWEHPGDSQTKLLLEEERAKLKGKKALSTSLGSSGSGGEKKAKKAKKAKKKKKGKKEKKKNMLNLPEAAPPLHAHAPTHPRTRAPTHPRPLPT